MGAVEMTECLLISEGKTMTQSWLAAPRCSAGAGCQPRSVPAAPAELCPQGHLGKRARCSSRPRHTSIPHFKEI